MWSRLTFVMTETSGSADVGASRTARRGPTSITATSHPPAAEVQEPEGGADLEERRRPGRVALGIHRRTAAATSPMRAASSLRLIGTPSTWMRSRTSRQVRRGEQAGRGSRRPAGPTRAWPTVEPLPLVPATWTSRTRSCGSPSRRQDGPHPLQLQVARPRLPPLVVDAAVPEGQRLVVGHPSVTTEDTEHEEKTALQRIAGSGLLISIALPSVFSVPLCPLW